MPRVVLLLLLLAWLPGCALYSLTPEEREMLTELERFELRSTEAGTVPPTKVGLANAWGPIGLLFGPDLGVVPLGGAGNFFLASRVEEGTGQFWLGVFNSLTWPISPLWSVPQVVEDSYVVNEKETVFHFTRSVRGVHQLRRWRAEAIHPPLPGPQVDPLQSSFPSGDVADGPENE